MARSRKDLEIAVRVVDKDLRKLKAELRAVNKAGGGTARDLSRQFSRAGRSMESLGRGLTAAVTLPLVGMGAAAVKTLADFQVSMNQVAAATKAPQSEVAELTALAKKMGADTIYSANESAAAMLELAKSGLTPAQIKAGALQATLQLAAAGNLELADAATTTANAMNMFGMTAKDANRAANALAGGANESSASVESLREALSQVGPGAKNAGLSLEETVAVLAAFADKGIQGSDAGTSLKTMLQRLVPQTDKQALAMKKLGLEFTTAKGKFKDIDEIAQELQDSFKGLTEKQRAQRLQTIFGSDATRAATVLMGLGEQGLQKYIKATQDQTAAQTMADARMKGLSGAIEQMKGSVETAALAYGEALEPTIRSVAKSVKELADWFSSLDGETQGTIATWGLVAAAAGPLLLITGKMASATSTLIRVTGEIIGWLTKRALAHDAAAAAATRDAIATNSAALAGGKATGAASGLGSAVTGVGLAMGAATTAVVAGSVALTVNAAKKENAARAAGTLAEADLTAAEKAALFAQRTGTLTSLHQNLSKSLASARAATGATGSSYAGLGRSAHQAAAEVAALNRELNTFRGANGSVTVTPNVHYKPRAGGGTVYEPLTLVGEQGPELVSLPPGSYVHTARQTERMVGSVVIHINNPAPGTDLAGVEAAAYRGYKRAERETVGMSRLRRGLVA